MQVSKRGEGTAAVKEQRDKDPIEATGGLEGELELPGGLGPNRDILSHLNSCWQAMNNGREQYTFHSSQGEQSYPWSMSARKGGSC